MQNKTTKPATKRKWPVVTHGEVFGRYLQQARRRAGLTLLQAAAEAGVGTSYLCHLENGKVREPRLLILGRLVRLYRLNAAEALGRVGFPLAPLEDFLGAGEPPVIIPELGDLTRAEQQFIQELVASLARAREGDRPHYPGATGRSQLTPGP